MLSQFVNKDVSFSVSINRSGWTNATPQTVESVTKATASLRNRWRSFRKIHILQHECDLPDELQQRVMKSGGDIADAEGWYDPKTKTVYLIAENLASPEHAIWVAVHEVVGHGGLRMLGKSVSKVLDHVAKNSLVSRLADAIANDRAGARDGLKVVKLLLDNDNLGFGDSIKAWHEFKKNPYKHNLPENIVTELLSQRVLIGRRIATDEAIAELAAAIVTRNTDHILTRYGVKVHIGKRNNLLANVKRKSFKKTSDSDIFSMIDAARQKIEGRLGVDAKCQRGSFGFCFTSPVRRRVAQAGQGVSARTV